MTLREALVETLAIRGAKAVLGFAEVAGRGGV
jgi:hypothetical protein